MPLLKLPNELLLAIADNLGQKHLFALICTSRHFASLLVPRLQTLGARETVGHTALNWAAQHGHEALAEALLSKGAAVVVEARYPWEQITALHWAAKSGSEAIIKLLLEHGTDINALTAGDTETPLFWATVGGQEAAVRLLLEKGASANIDYPVEPPLPKAIRDGRAGITKLLLEGGADVRRYDSFGMRPIHWAASGWDEEVMRLLLEKDADVEAAGRSELKGTPLHLAAAGGHLAAIKLLLERGANIEARTQQKSETPLGLAALTGKAAAVELLLEKGADVNARCGDGSTALHLAAAACDRPAQQDVIRILLAKGADANAQNHAGDTPLREPIICRYRKNAAALVEGGADPFIKEVDGDPVLDEGEKRGDFSMARLIVRYGTKGFRERIEGSLRSHGRILGYMVKPPLKDMEFEPALQEAGL